MQIGFVGAGGLGQELRTAISLQEYTNLSALFPPHIWTDWREIQDSAKGLGETLATAVLGMVLGALVAFPLSFPGAKKINRIPLLRFTLRRGFALEALILALVFICAFGLGPLAGVLAIAVIDLGSLAKALGRGQGDQLRS